MPLVTNLEEDIKFNLIDFEVRKKTGLISEYKEQCYGYIWSLRYLIFVIGLIVYVDNMWTLTSLLTQPVPDPMFQNTHPIVQAQEILRDDFEREKKIEINFVWGIEPVLWNNTEEVVDPWKAQT